MIEKLTCKDTRICDDWAGLFRKESTRRLLSCLALELDSVNTDLHLDSTYDLPSPLYVYRCSSGYRRWC